MIGLVGFVTGFLVGGYLGVVTMCLINVSKKGE